MGFLNPTQKQTFETRICRYLMAGGAILGLPAASSAAIVWSGPMDVAVDVLNSPVSVNLNPVGLEDPNGDILDDFQLSAFLDSSGFMREVEATTLGSTLFNIGPLAYGEPITLANTTSSGANTLLKQSIAGNSGTWQANQSRYLGMQFAANSQTHLGWANITIHENSSPALTATIHSWGYETVAGESILAGAGSPEPVPEPSSLALFALGAAGIAALRRRSA